ncbi:shikimate dehydrogenase family protein [Rubrivirga sp.]|uniref:shikimate dehydrogenase family protein n=1 Tax=Rubrivirga sp. TaxID=1885344 RepID=UPI003B5202A9
MPTAMTGLVVLLGHPVGHSLSPALHNAAFAHDALDLVYLACDVEDGRLEEAMSGLWALGGRGANVTIPHKRAALALASQATPTARALGAANTLVRTDVGWRADNTDVAGFLAPLADVSLTGESAVVFGAGGAARAVVHAVLTKTRATRVTVVARRPAQAEELADDLGTGPVEIRVEAPATAGASVRDAALVVNATPLGMGDGRTPWPDDGDFRPGQVVYDVVYRPARTPLLEAAAARGATTVGGLPMLLGQAGESYRQWTGRPFPLDVARRVALRALA